jgi:hypothetical protein
MQDSITHVTPTNTLFYNSRLQFLHGSFMFRRCHLAIVAVISPSFTTHHTETGSNLDQGRIDVCTQRIITA